MKRCWYVILAFFLFSCSPRALHEAQDVVSQADSLWQQGEMYRDSVSLAQAYSTLGNWKWFYADEYAHSCYHYGKLLRAQDDPVSAMRVFINATHTPTHDYHILGRVYSNMGDIAHLAGEYSLAYDMYEESANMYLSNGDSLLYYYGLNNMAYELAERGNEDETLQILGNIEKDCGDKYVLLKTIETKAVLYKKVKQYDSVIYYTSQLLALGTFDPAVLIIRAQAYSFLGVNDSAVYYANIVQKQSSDLTQINNALYILTNNDETKDIDSIRESAADRSDVQKQLSDRQGKLSQAVQLLELYLNRKPDWRRYVIWALLTISILLFVIGLHVWKKRKHQLLLLSQKHATDIIESIKKHIDVTDLKTTLHWKDYVAMKSDADLYMGGIVTKLESYHLNEVEIRFCILTLLDFPLKKIAETIYYSYPSAIKTLKKRIANKLGTTPSSLKDFLLHLPPQT